VEQSRMTPFVYSRWSVFVTVSGCIVELVRSSK
jgi:hypothetical protein